MDPPEKKKERRMMNLKLVSIFTRDHWIRTLTGKEWRNFTQINGYLIKINESLKKRVGGRENKGNLGTDEMNNIGKLRDDLANVEMIGST